ncbi:MAG: hypothetical protein ACE3JP_08245 [Ectobacillus sp.]
MDRKARLFQLMLMFWRTENEQLQDSIVKAIYRELKEDIENEL